MYHIHKVIYVIRLTIVKIRSILKWSFFCVVLVQHYGVIINTGSYMTYRDV
jgi:hypothetical protein